MILDMLSPEEIEQLVGQYLCEYYNLPDIFEMEEIGV